MKTLAYKAKIDNIIMGMLKISEIRHIIAHTNKGDLCLMLPFRGTGKDYRFVLDAVPFDDIENKALIEVFKGILFV